MNLVNKCVCGCGVFISVKKNKINLMKCDCCGLLRQSMEMTKQELASFYSDKYQDGIYIHSFENDLDVAKKRLKKYCLPDKIRLLDVGCGKGAFVQECRHNDIDSYGVDLLPIKGVNIPDTYYEGELQNIHFPTDYFDVVTCHDVLEHILNPIEYVEEIFRMTKQEGTAYIEIPDFYVKEGKKHWKKTEHIWYFDEKYMINLLRTAGFGVKEVYLPIKGKMVFVCVKPKQKRVKILVPPGIGDSYWSLIKLQDFCKKKDLGIPDIYISSPGESTRRAYDFVQNIPFVCVKGYIKHNARKSPFFEAYHNDDKSIYENVAGCQYFISYNGKMRFEKSPDTEDLEYKTDWFPPMFESVEEKAWKTKLKDEIGPYYVAYFINHGMYKKWLDEFNISKIKELLWKLSQITGKKIVFVGAPWDKEYIEKSIMEPKYEDCFVNYAGETNLRQCFGIMKGSEGVIGFPSGITIMSTVFRIPTFMFWHKYFNPVFWRDACPPQAHLHWYDYVSTDEATVDNCSNRIFKLFNIDIPVKKEKKVHINHHKYTVVSVYKTGGDFDETYVRKMQSMLMKRLTVDYKYIVLTNAKLDFCETVPLQEGWKTWWSKIELFRPGLFDKEPTLYIDLDMIIANNIDNIFSHNGNNFLMMSRYRKPDKRGSAIMYWNGDYRDIYHRLKNNQDRITMENRSDQEFIENFLKSQNKLSKKVVQDYLRVYSFKHDCERKNFIKGANIIGFHGNPRPHEVEVNWVKDLWQ